jgi:hypothetical protein
MGAAVGLSPPPPKKFVPTHEVHVALLPKRLASKLLMEFFTSTCQSVVTVVPNFVTNKHIILVLIEYD